MRLNLWNNQSPSKTFIPTHAYIYADSQAHTFLKTFRLPTQSIKQTKFKIIQWAFAWPQDYVKSWTTEIRRWIWEPIFSLLLGVFLRQRFAFGLLCPPSYSQGNIYTLKERDEIHVNPFFSYWNQQMRVTQSWHFEIFLKKLICWRQSLFSWQADFFHKVLLLGTCLCCSDVNSFSCPIFLTEITEVCCSHPLNHGIFSYFTPNWKMGFRMFWS